MRKPGKTTVGYAVNIAGILILSFLIVRLMKMVANVGCVTVINNGYNEIRDYASFRLAHLFFEGKNPYTLDNLNYNVPFACLYTPIYPAMVAFVCRVLDCDIVGGYYVVNIFVYFVTSFFIWLTVKDYFDNSKFIGIIAVTINVGSFFALFDIPILNFHTDTIGILMISMMMFILKKYKEKTAILALLTVWLVFTKQILIVIAVPVFIYYLIENRKFALKYFCQCVVIGLFTVAAVQIICPLYWTETVYFQFAVSGDSGTVSESVKNLTSCYRRYIPYFVLAGSGVVLSAVIDVVKKDFSINAKTVKRLIKEHDFALFLILNILISSLALLYIARAYEDGYKYCQDMLSPSFFLLCVYIWNGCLVKKLDKIKLANKEINQGVCVIVMCIVTTLVLRNFGDKVLNRWDSYNMLHLDRILTEHDGEKIYVGLNATPYLINRNMWEPESNVYFNDGQTEYFIGNLPDLPINTLFYEEEISEAANHYAERVNNMVANREFGVVATSVENIIDMDVLEDNYEEYETVRIETATNICYPVTVWLPRED